MRRALIRVVYRLPLYQAAVHHRREGDLVQGGAGAGGVPLRKIPLAAPSAFSAPSAIINQNLSRATTARVSEGRRRGSFQKSCGHWYASVSVK